MLLLEGDVGPVQLIAGSFGQDVQRKLVDGLRALHLLLPLLELRKLDVELLVKLIAQHLDSLLVARTRAAHIVVLLLELAEAEEGLLCWAATNISLHDAAPLVNLATPLFELAVLQPRAVLGLPLHPALVYGPRPGIICQELLHVRVFVPELVHPGQQLRDPVEEIAGMVYKLVLHLHLEVFQPNADILVLHMQGPFEDGPSPAKLLLRRLPLRILGPSANILPLPTDDVFKLLPLADAIHLQLVLVDDTLPRWLCILLLSVHRLAEELFGRDLLGVGSLVTNHGLLAHARGVLWPPAAALRLLANLRHGSQ
mmetsp:Transcript_97219/g.299705  ORF Transcript_97219/g.299705 Transcript_97219/m.299705 type:complete len:312 (-) Transcript_97219:149-1084(-)